jgi:hypothetical protein
MSLVGIVSGPFCHACRQQFERGERIAAEQDRAYHLRCLNDVRAAGGIDEWRVAAPTAREAKLEAELAEAKAALAAAETLATNAERGYRREKKRAQMYKDAAERATASAMRGAAALRPAPAPAASTATAPPPVPPTPPPVPNGPADDPADRFRVIELD